MITEQHTTNNLKAAIPEFVAAIRAIAEAAALWHDTGKANLQFQSMLRGDYYGKHDYRHHTLSHASYSMALNQPESILSATFSVMPSSSPAFDAGGESNMASSIVAAVILTHHMKAKAFDGQRFTLDTDNFGAAISAPKEHISVDLSGLSEEWRTAVEQAHQQIHRLNDSIPPSARSFYFYAARAVMMLADHAASATEKRLKTFDDARFQKDIAYAKSSPVISLDEHLLDVTHFCDSATEAFLTYEWPRIEREPEAMAAAPTDRFAWQATAERAIQAASISVADGFFGVMSSETGSGKTQGGYRIMSALAQGKPRYTLGLGYGALAIQSGIEYRRELGLESDEAAIFVGRRHAAAKHEQEAQLNTSQEKYGNYGLDLEDGGHISEIAIPCSVSEAMTPDQQRLINTPIVSLTIDHVIEAMTAHRGTFVNAALRVATADLLIDEIDSFTLSDLHAVGRLIYVTGLFGRKVVISSATVTPEIAQGLFNAYRAGYQQYQASNGSGRLMMGAFSNQGAKAFVTPAETNDAFKNGYDAFITPIADSLKASQQRRKIGVVEITKIKQPRNRPSPKGGTPQQLESLCGSLFNEALRLAAIHHTNLPSGISVATGFVRFNLNENAQVFAKWIVRHHEQLEKESGWCIRINYYGGRLDSASRQYIESRLGLLLNRKNDEYQANDEMRAVEHDAKGRPVLCLLVTTPLIEVGRDYDLDFAILEPASDMSIIQAAGRVLRHRSKKPAEPNVILMSRSMRSLFSNPTKNARYYGNRGPGVEQRNPVTQSEITLPSRNDAKELFGVQHYLTGIHSGYRLHKPASIADRCEREHQIITLLNTEPLSLKSFTKAILPFASTEYDGISFRRQEPGAANRAEYEIISLSEAISATDNSEKLILEPPKSMSNAECAIWIMPPLSLKGGYFKPYRKKGAVIEFSRWIGCL